MALGTTGRDRKWLVAASLLALFIAALFLRSYWNLDAAHPAEGQFLLSGGSDPYYHKHAVDAILDPSDRSPAEGKFRTLVHDPLLNYPYGSVNPNPPLYQWTVALVGHGLQGLFSPVTGTDSAGTAVSLSSEQVATWWAALWLPAIFGALTIFPIYFIGKTLFDRRVGLIAALFWAISTAAIDQTGLGLADHDAMLMFFVTLAFLFYIKMIDQFRGDGNWVVRWRDGAAVRTGMGNLFRSRRAGFAFAALAGMSLAALALVWKGFPYAIGIIFIYAVFQMVIDHWRSRDSTGLFLGTLLAFLIGTLVPYYYYDAAGVLNFLTPVLFIVGAFALLGAVLVPTRDLPTILVMPAAVVVGIVAALAALFVFPNVAQKLLHATVYFKQSTLYTTIAEAHPASFSRMAFAVGPAAFLIGIAAWFGVLIARANDRARAWLYTAIGAAGLGAVAILYAIVELVQDKSGLDLAVAEQVCLFLALAVVVAWFLMVASLNAADRGLMFALVWGVVALFMASSAVRFLFNAIPVFALFGAIGVVAIIDWLDFRAIRKQVAGADGRAELPMALLGGLGLLAIVLAPFAGAFIPTYGILATILIALLGIPLYYVASRRLGRLGFRHLHAVAVVAIALLLVLPNAILAADAALPASAESSLGNDALQKRLGAYGQDYLSPGWQDSLAWLDSVPDYPNGSKDPAQRPAFLSWWDYGHWAISVGNHPTVADNFQNGYEFAAHFLLSQNETHAIQLLATRGFGVLSDATDGLANWREVRDKAVPLLIKQGMSEDQARMNFGLLYGCPPPESCGTSDRAAYQFAPHLDTPAKAAGFLKDVEAESCKTKHGCKKIRYFATDIRMLPYDNPATADIAPFPEQSSIFFPVIELAGREADDYVAVKVSTGGTSFMSIDEFNRLADDPIDQVQITSQRLEFQPAFFNSMYWRGHVGLPVTAQTPGQPILGSDELVALRCKLPAYGLEHFRLVYANGEVTIVEYYEGAPVEGVVTEDGAPVSNVTVTVYDDAAEIVKDSEFFTLVEGRVGCPGDSFEGNVPHATATTDASGRYELLAPFSLAGGVKIVASRDGVPLSNATIQITRAEASVGPNGTAKTADIAVVSGAVEVAAFLDGDNDGQLNSTDGSNDTRLPDVRLRLADSEVETDSDGNATFPKVPGGVHVLSAVSDLYEVVTSAGDGSAVTVSPNETTTHRVLLRHKAVAASFQLFANETGNETVGPNVAVDFVPAAGGQTVTRATNETGEISLDLMPGTYTVNATFEGRTLTETLVVEPGQTVREEYRFRPE